MKKIALENDVIVGIEVGDEILGSSLPGIDYAIVRGTYENDGDLGSHCDGW